MSRIKERRLYYEQKQSIRPTTGEIVKGCFHPINPGVEGGDPTEP